MGSTTAGVAWDGVLLGAALVLFGFFVVMSVIPLSEAPVLGAGGTIVVGFYVMVVRRQVALGLLLAATGAAVLAYLYGLL